MKMVGHQAVSQNSHRLTKCSLAHHLQKGVVVIFLTEDLRTSVASIEDMISESSQGSPSNARQRINPERALKQTARLPKLSRDLELLAMSIFPVLVTSKAKMEVHDV
jgi:hypothetical protein